MVNDSFEMKKSGTHERRANSKAAFATQHLRRAAVFNLKESMSLIL